MQLFKLNDDYSPGNTVNKFESLAWTERYRDAGDFQLVVMNEISILSKLPTGCLISHTDTREVMIVENHEVGRGSNKDLTITLTGRSFETFAENRLTTGSEEPLNDLSDPPVANVFTSPVESSAQLVERLLKLALQAGAAPAYAVIPNLSIYLDMSVLDAAMEHVVQRGELYSRVLEYLGLCNAGIKTIRPLVGETTLDLVIHDGNDLLNSVVFNDQREDLEDAKYFWSIKGYKNYAQLAANTYARLHRHRDLVSDLTGLDWRVLYVDANDIEGIYDPPDASDVVSARSQTALDNNKRVALLTAKISQSAKPKFKIDYDVGDLVMVFGEFATSQAMRVTEHMLTVDKSGTRGYPSLTIV